MPAYPDDAAQEPLFAESPGELPVGAFAAEQGELAARLPPSIRIGCSSWSYPGWIGSVYAPGVKKRDLARLGLSAYAKHPLLRTVEIDRSYYDPLSAEELAGLARQVPGDFRFVMKAHEDTVVPEFPSHPRYGERRGRRNPLFLDASYATDKVVAPFVDGLGDKGGAILFQLPPHDVRDAEALASRLHAFLTRLPRGLVYAVEARNPEILTPSYAKALEDAGAVHCHSVWGSMPPVASQARAIPPRARSPLFVRWLRRPSVTFEQAEARYAPFDRTIDEDPPARERIASLVARADAHGVPALVVVSNHAEGHAPESVLRLARAIVSRGATP